MNRPPKRDIVPFVNNFGHRITATKATRSIAVDKDGLTFHCLLVEFDIVTAGENEQKGVMMVDAAIWPSHFVKGELGLMLDQIVRDV